jgi:hypothetical protein
LRHSRENTIGGSVDGGVYGRVGVAFRAQGVLDDLSLIAIGNVERLSTLGSVAVNGNRLET